MTAPLGQLLSDSWSSFRRALMPIVVGAVVFGLLLGIGQSFIGQRVTQKAGSVFEGLGFDQQQMQDLQQRIQAGDQAAMNEFAQKMEQLGGAQGEAVSGAVLSMYKGLLPVIGASMLIMWLISLIASAYFLLIGLNDKLTFQSALARTPGLIIPLFLLSLWVLIRSFFWIPALGIILAIILGPRFILAPVFIVRDHKGVLESASMSYANTSGFWGKIFGNVFVAAIVILVAQMVLGFVLGFFGMRISGILMPMVQMLATAFLTIFVVKLAVTIQQNPIRA
ncbi:MAG: hypothetical protein PHX87_01210 [Candidatus Peribacteraceae bacterium]|nr:hypothetical protein [Candidatus Peribacteraceae bacterium]MDD5742028.1 hypothetical protein [Candidatus Peribacteraceae bacterium]